MKRVDIPFYRQLRFKVITLFASIVLIVELVAGFVATNLGVEQFRDSLHEKFQTTFAMSENTFSLVGQMGLAWVDHFVIGEGLSALVEWGEQGVVKDHIATLKNDASADVLIVLDQKGQIVAHTEGESLIGESLMSWYMVRKAMHQKEIVVSIVQDQTSLIIYVPGILYDESGAEVRGMVLIGYVINDALISNISKSTLIDITVVRRRGIMASTFNQFNERLINNPMNYLEYQSLLEDEYGANSQFGKMYLNDSDYFVVAHDLKMMDPAMEGSIMLSYPVSELDAIKTELRQQLLFITIVSFVLIVFVGVRFSNRLLLPLQRLLSYTEQLESGKSVERQVEVFSDDEVGVLASRFNHLLNTIEMKNRQLRSYSESLEQKVNESTKELVASYMDLHEKEKGLERAQQIAHLGSWEWRIESEHINCSKQLLRILATEKDVGSLSFVEMMAYVRPDHREKIENLFRSAIIDGRMDTVEYSIIRSDGVERFVSTEAELIPAKPGSLARLVGVTQDITERKEAEKIRVELQRQLHEAKKMQTIGQMTGGVAHEFNNMLASILGNVDLALLDIDAETDKEMEDYLKQISLSGLRARDLVAKMQTFGRVGEAQLQSHMLKPLLQESLKMLASALPESVDVQLKIEDGLCIKADSSGFNQVIKNLCLNARDAMEGQGRIEIKARKVKDIGLECDSCHEFVVGNFVKIVVSDQGCGIKSEDLEQIFVPFFTTKEVGRGTGMGLSIVHGLMHEHGGHIVVTSRPGEGSRFVLLFPMTLPAEDDVSADR